VLLRHCSGNLNNTSFFSS